LASRCGGGDSGVRFPLHSGKRTPNRRPAVGPGPKGHVIEIDRFQELMARTYGARDRVRGRDATVAWLAEEVGELAKAARKGTQEEQLHELGDVLAWLASLAEQLGLSLEEAAGRYAEGCPRCRAMPCACP
jgi:NTP pyrophosphatase (non-canonical NTP hydrolase)